MRLSYRYRLYPTQSQIKILENTFYLCRFTWNCALEERNSYYKTYNKPLSYNAQSKQLPELKVVFPEFKTVYSQVFQNVFKRLDNAFQNFFKSGSGYPRFKGVNRFRSILYSQKGFSVKQKSNGSSRIFLSKIGHVKINLHRPIVGKIKTCCVIKTSTGKWYVNVSCDDVPEEHLSKTGKSIGLDLGVKKFLVTSNNEAIENPKYLNKSKGKLKLAQQRLSKLSKKDSKRQAAKLHVARVHEKIFNQRDDFQHKTSLKIVRENDQIFCEDLEIKNMSSWRVLNRAISDCAWGKFVDKVTYKAERAGKLLTKVDPRNTTKLCSKCGKIVEKSLSDRIHKCECGLEIDRDLNAAINIFNRGMAKIAIPRKSG